MGRTIERHTPAVEDYAKAIYTLQERADGPVSTTALAERLRNKTAKAADLFDRYAQLAIRMPKEFGVLSMRDGQAMCNHLVAGKLDTKPHVKLYIEANQSLWRTK